MGHIENAKICPSCNSKRIESRNEIRIIPMPFAKPIEHNEVIDHCLDCDMEGDFLEVNENNLPAIIEAAKKESAKLMINDLVENHGLSMSYMERAFDLPMRTMTRWKSGDISAAALGLLRLMKTYPWLVEVADSQYDKVFATHRLAMESINAMKEFAGMCNWDTQLTLNRSESASRKSVDAVLSFTQKGEFIVHQETSPSNTEKPQILGAFA